MPSVSRTANFLVTLATIDVKITFLRFFIILVTFFAFFDV